MECECGYRGPLNMSPWGMLCDMCARNAEIDAQTELENLDESVEDA